MKSRREGKARAEPSAYQRALGLLVRREHSRQELSRKLRARGVEADEADSALATLARQDFQNDARFAEALARSRAVAGYGPVRIRAELGTHGLGRDLVDAALAACEGNWQDMASQLAARRFAGKDMADPAIRRKVVDFLLRRGFDQRAAYAAGRRLRGEDEFED